MSFNLGPEHSRTRLVDQAETELQKFMFEMIPRLGLTMIETLRILATAQETLIKHALRHERHPDEPGKGADDA